MLAILLLTGGGSCAFVASSGSSSTKDDEQRSNFLLVIRDGQLVDAPVEGVRFTSGTLTGLTGPNGEFQFQEGAGVRFFIGDIPLGERVPGRALMSPVDLVPGGDLDTTAVINIARLLQSLDAVPGDRRITVPATLHAKASGANREIASAVAFIDYADNTSFNNIASQLLAVLTDDYGFTVVLVDAASARQHLQDTLTLWGWQPR